MYHPIIDRLKTIAELLPTAIGGEFIPSGTKQISITQNGNTTENVFSYANAEISVNVPTGITPTGTKQISITQNGTTTEDVTNYASAEITVNVPSSGGGGTSITDGIVFTEKDSIGYVIKADIYGNVPENAFGTQSAAALGARLTNVTFKTPLTKIGWGAFQKSALTELIIPDSVTEVGGQLLRGNTAAIRYVHENAGNKYGYNGGATKALEQIGTSPTLVQLGAIGKPVTHLYYQFMTSRAYESMTLIIYCVGSNVDSFLSTARQAVTGGTIVFKASEETTYNGTTYNDGDTILTSEVT